MKTLLTFTLLLCSSYASAGRMPESIDSVEALGKSYVKLNITKESADADYDFQIVNTLDIKRLVGSSNKKECYLFYFTSVELLKIHVANQSCSNLTKELMLSLN